MVPAPVPGHSPRPPALARPQVTFRRTCGVTLMWAGRTSRAWLSRLRRRPQGPRPCPWVSASVHTYRRGEPGGLSDNCKQAVGWLPRFPEKWRFKSHNRPGMHLTQFPSGGCPLGKSFNNQVFVDSRPGISGVHKTMYQQDTSTPHINECTTRVYTTIYPMCLNLVFTPLTCATCLDCPSTTCVYTTVGLMPAAGSAGQAGHTEGATSRSRGAPGGE